LDRRGIAYGELRPLISPGPDGSKNTLWTNVTLRQFSDGEAADATMHVFLSEYSLEYVNVDQRRARLRSQLAEKAGGPLGVEAVKEVVVGVTDLEAARGRWQKLLDPAPMSGPSTWQVSDGPAIRLVQARENTTQELVITVASLPRAKAFLREKGYSELIRKKRRPLIRLGFMPSRSEWSRKRDRLTIARRRDRQESRSRKETSARRIRFGVVLALLVAGAHLHHLWAQSADEAAVTKIAQLWDDHWNRHEPKGMRGTQTTRPSKNRPTALKPEHESLPKPKAYSARSATIGSTRVARRAGR
jgi:hypothetical protein